MSLTGRWEGKLIDVSGPMARLEMDINDNQGAISGNFSVAFLADDPSGCGDIGGQTTSQSGVITGKVNGDQVRIDYTLNVGGATVAVSFGGEVAKADPHALRALFGSYDVLQGADSLTLQGGACTLWLYGDALAERRAK